MPAEWLDLGVRMAVATGAGAMLGRSRLLHEDRSLETHRLRSKWLHTVTAAAVSGTAISAPAMPHTQFQNVIATMIASGESAHWVRAEARDGAGHLLLIGNPIYFATQG